MGIFSSDEEPMWSDVFALRDKLKRLQEENEELKAKNAILILANSGIEEKNEQLNERVKTFTKPKYYYKGLQKTEEEKDKYKQALEEIREIANYGCLNELADNSVGGTRCFRIYTKANEILNKISEILEDTEDENTNTL